MTETPIPRLIIALGIPTTISMMITNVYNMADSYFVSQISLSAGGATSIVFGIMSILQAFGFMFGHGAGSYVSRLLGRKETKKASTYASTSFFSAILCGLIIMTVGLIFLAPLMRLLGSTETILPHAMGYGRWILIAAPAMTASCVLNNLLRYEGKAALAMIGLSTGGLLNILLDPLFIFTLDLGTEGAGMATALSQYISFFILLSVFLLKKSQCSISVRCIAKHFSVYRKIIVTGLPSLARQGLNSVSTMVLNSQARLFGDAAIAAMGYVIRVSSLIFSVGLGIGQGFQPVAGFNWGAKRFDRVMDCYKYAAKMACLGSAIMAGLIAIFANPIITAFAGSDPQMQEIGALCIRTQCLALPVHGWVAIVNMLCAGLGNAGGALALSTSRQGSCFVPMLYPLVYFFGAYGIASVQAVADVLSLALAIPIALYMIKKIRNAQALHEAGQLQDE